MSPAAISAIEVPISTRFEGPLDLETMPSAEVYDLADRNAEYCAESPIFDQVSATSAPKLYYKTSKNPAIRAKSPTDNNLGEAPEGPQPIPWNLPDKGEEKAPVYVHDKKYREGREFHCGDRRHVEACARGDYLISRNYHCGRIACPKCWRNAISRAVNDRILPKLTAYAVIKEREGSPVFPYHVVLSQPPQIAAGNTWNREDFNKNRKEAQRLLSKLGGIGGVMFFHPFRKPKDGASVWRVGPHYHAIVFFDHPITKAELAEKIPASYAANGWIVKFPHASEELPGYEMFEEVAGGLLSLDKVGGLVRYLMSHMGVAEETNIRAYCYFGDCYNVCKRDSETPIAAPSLPSIVCCPECEQSNLYDYREIIRYRRSNLEYQPEPLMEDRRVFVWSRWSDDDVQRLRARRGDLNPEYDYFPERVFLDRPRDFVVFDDCGNVIPPDAPYLSYASGRDMLALHLRGLNKREFSRGRMSNWGRIRWPSAIIPSGGVASAASAAHAGPIQSAACSGMPRRKHGYARHAGAWLALSH